MGPRNRVLGGVPGKGAILGVVLPLPLNCIWLCKQQTSWQHGAADLSAGTACHDESEASEWTDLVSGCRVMVNRVNQLSVF